MVLKANNLKKSFNDKVIIDNKSFELSQGNILCVTGDSGKGKTTLLNICAGMLPSDTGEVFVDEKKIENFHDFTKYIAYMPCGRSLLDSLTVEENINFFNAEQKRENDIIRRLKIQNILKSYPYEISSGEYKRVCLCRISHSPAPFIFLDEPTSNLDRESAELVIDEIKALKKEKGILIATHDKRITDIGDGNICI